MAQSHKVRTWSGSDRVHKNSQFFSNDPVATTTPRGLPPRGPRPAPGSDSVSTWIRTHARACCAKPFQISLAGIYRD
jgi:hypothetical protein